MKDKIFEHLDAGRDTVIELQERLVALPALGPDNNGQGEKDKADFLLDYLRQLGVPEIREMPAPDPRVACGFRPNIAARIPGQNPDKTFWIISHTDIVPPGDLGLWQTDPYVLKVEDDTLYGRGVEDNHQGIVSSLLLAKALLDLDVTPPLGLGLLLVSDEETGSRYGLDFVVKNHGNLFRENDLFLVPDFGVPDSTMIEVAEKSMLWLKISVYGKQCHASTPEEGINSLTAASAFVLKLRGLYEDYTNKNSLFSPPGSTFEATKKEANVPNVNTIPGLDVFYLDCRVLPEYELSDVMRTIAEYGREISGSYGVRIEYEAVQKVPAAPPTDPKSEIVARLAAGIEHVYGVTANPMGVGGGTVAAFLRREGYPTAVWATCVPNAHQPNERSLISTQINDAKVMARVLMGP
ncbi:MAG: M20 family metallo-hydrolase [Thermodesulfobacteriota bacterium]|nr:M20 family metallo-hydrolase [Thermodesulfobacteriota bacterium]